MKVANPPKSSQGKTVVRANEAKEYGVVVGTLAGFDADGAPLIAFGDKPAVAAMTLVDMREEHIGMRVAVQFESGNQSLPLVMGVVRKNCAHDEPVGALESFGLSAAALHATVDDDEVVLVAQRRITLRCGAASQGNRAMLTAAAHS